MYSSETDENTGEQWVLHFFICRLWESLWLWRQVLCKALNFV